MGFVLLILAVPLLAACTTGQLDALPKEIGGLPEGAPKRQENPPPFPAVHDMPPPRSQALMDKDQQTRLESDLVAARNKLQTQQNQAKAAVKSSAQAQTPAAKAPAQAQKSAATVKRSKRPTALSDDNSGASGRAPANSAGQAPSAAPAPAAANNASGAAWPSPPAAR